MHDYSHLYKLQKQMAEQAAQIRRSLAPTYHLQESIRESERIWRSQMRGLSGMVEWQKSVSQILQSYASTRGTAERLLAEGNAWTEVVRKINAEQRLLSTITLPSTVWQDSVSRMVEGFAGVRIPDLYPHLASHLLAAHESYSRFSRSSLIALGEGLEEEEEAALSGALTLAEEQITGGTDVIVELLDDLDSGEVDASSDAPIINVFEAQKADLMANSRLVVTASATELLTLSPVARVATKARAVTQMAIRCNRAAKLGGDDEIFTPTTTYIEAQNQLQWLTVGSEIELGRLVDSLYLMLYEGAGKDNLRFLRYLDEEKCGVVWAVKHLRNKLLRHDPDHGKQSSQAKSWRDLGSSLRTLGFKRFPSTPDEFQKLQEALLREVESFLDALYEALPEIAE